MTETEIIYCKNEQCAHFLFEDRNCRLKGVYLDERGKCVSFEPDVHE